MYTVKVFELYFKYILFLIFIAHLIKHPFLKVFFFKTLSVVVFAGHFCLEYSLVIFLILSSVIFSSSTILRYLMVPIHALRRVELLTFECRRLSGSFHNLILY